jgi:hypothetical protein
MKPIHLEPALKILEPSGKELSPVKERTMYPDQFPILLRERLQGRSVVEVAEYLGIRPGDVHRLLQGQWRPSKEICRRMGLRVVYAITDDSAAAGLPDGSSTGFEETGKRQFRN